MASAKPEVPRSSPSNGSADSYVGSLISLTSKSEIRYEGYFCDISREDSTIGLTNVRSFGTEGRKQDGPQVGPSDKVYEYILFRGSDIKDLRVISSPPVQATASTSVFNDPAIIQTHHPQAANPSASAQPSSSGLTPDLSAQNPQSGLIRPTFQSNPPLYQPVGNLGPWAQSPSLPTTNGSAITPMYYPGYYASPNGVQHEQLLTPLLSLPMSSPMQETQHPTMNLPFSLPYPMQPQQSLLTPPPGLSMPSSAQQTQYPTVPLPFSQSLLTPPMPSPVQQTPHQSAVNIPFSTGASGITALDFSQSPSTFLPMPNFQPSPLPAQPTSSLNTGTLNLQPLTQQTTHHITADIDSSKSPSALLPIPSFQSSVLPPQSSSLSLGNFSFPSPMIPTQSSPVVSESSTKLVFSRVPTQPSPLVISLDKHTSQNSEKPVTAPDSDVPVKTSEPSPVVGMPNLITPGQLFQPGTSTASLAQTPRQKFQKDNEVARASVIALPEPSQSPPQLSGLLPSQAQEPLLPLPSPAEYKPHTTHRHPYPRHNHRGGSQRGRGYGMSRPVTRFTKDFDFTAMNEKFNKDEVWGDIGKSIKAQENGNESQDDDDVGSTKPESNPVYVKDDFFDSLSCNSLNRESQNGRFNFSHQRKLDTETFGFVPRYNRGGRGGYGQGRGGYGQGRGGYYGRGGNGHVERGRGHDSPGRGS